MRKIGVIALAWVLPWAGAQAAIYKCVDSQGRVTYTNDNTNSKGCSQLEEDLPVSSVPALRPPPPAKDFPRVSPDQQKARDDSRRNILEEELAAEQTALDSAQKALAEQEGIRLGSERNYQRKLDRLKPFQDQVELHQRNVEALQKEISNLR
ncbi:MAG: DUF4124 domain-containing protein [Rhodocyclaceae bacterium]|nr:DUF4124 domain-containing protein [Rhodocyclaceae bacterium]